MTKVSEVMDCINTIESSCNVAAWRIYGVRIWPSARIRLSIRIRDHDFVGPKPQPPHRRGLISLLEGVSISILSLLQVVVSSGNRRGLTAMVLTKPSSPRRGFNIYSDPLREQLRARRIRHLAVEVSGRPHRPRSREPVLVLDRFWLAVYIHALYSLLRVFRRASVDLPGHRSAVRQVTARFPAVSGTALSRHSLIREATMLEANALFFRLLLRLFRPRLTFIICYYSPLAMGLILAARRRHSVTADYQHGVQGKLHYAYGSWTNFPAAGYELLPDLFLCWSDAEKRAIDEWAAPSPHRSIVVGNLLPVHVQNRFAGLARDHADRLMSLGTRPKVLYSLQNFVPPTWIWEAIRDTSGELKWLIRLHPLHPYLRKVVLENLGDPGRLDYDLDEASQLPLPLLLPSIDVHVTGNSSVVLEALQAGKPSIVIDHYGVEYYADLIAAGTVAEAFDPLQLRQALQSAISRAPVFSPATHTDSFQGFLDSHVGGKA